jgi:hypothetical protein
MSLEGHKSPQEFAEAEEEARPGSTGHGGHGGGSSELKGREGRTEGQERTSSQECLFASWRAKADAGAENLEGPVVLKPQPAKSKGEAVNR